MRQGATRITAVLFGDVRAGRAAARSFVLRANQVRAKGSRRPPKKTDSFVGPGLTASFPAAQEWRSGGEPAASLCRRKKTAARAKPARPLAGIASDAVAATGVTKRRGTRRFAVVQAVGRLLTRAGAAPPSRRRRSRPARSRGPTARPRPARPPAARRPRAGPPSAAASSSSRAGRAPGRSSVVRVIGDSVQPGQTDVHAPAWSDAHDLVLQAQQEPVRRSPTWRRRSPRAPPRRTAPPSTRS